MKRILKLIAVVTAGTAIVLPAIEAAASNAKPTAASAARSMVGVRHTALGRTLVDARGRTLYLFEADKANMSNCSGACLTVWPALTAHGVPRATGGAVASKIGTIRAHGGRQITYAHHPLYYYVGDRKPGDTNGQGLNQFGAKWYVLAPTGRKIDND
jgi:predicted lipoprotein with Yx(FWY)xxD motif